MAKTLDGLFLVRRESARQDEAALRAIGLIQKWTGVHGSIDAQAEKYDQWRVEGDILPWFIRIEEAF